MILETITISKKQILLNAQKRAVKLNRTQQIELDEDLFIRVAGGGRKFLLFALDENNFPTKEIASLIAELYELKNPQFDIYQGKTLKSLMVVENI